MFWLRWVFKWSAVIVLAALPVSAEPSHDPAYSVKWNVSGKNIVLLGLHLVDASTGWAVGGAGTILATRDAGTTWQAQKSGSDKDLIGVRFVDASTGWVVGRDGTAAPHGNV